MSSKRYEGHTPEPWRVSKSPYGAVVTDPSARTPQPLDAAEVEHYGGLLICESVRGSADRALIADAPMLLRQRDELVAALKVHGFDGRFCRACGADADKRPHDEECEIGIALARIEAEEAQS